MEVFKLTVFNHAGGAAKSSSARDIGFSLGRLGFRVLLIDVDPQANLTTWLGVEDASLERTIYATAMENAPLPEPYLVHGVHLIPAHLRLAMLQDQLAGVIGGYSNLQRQVRLLEDRYDFVLIDSPPSLGQLSLTAAVAADGLIVPVPTSHKGIGGLQDVHAKISEYRRVNPRLKVSYYLPTMHNPQIRHHREALEAMREMLKPLGSPITFRPAIYPDAHAAAVPIGVYAPGSPADREVTRATEELLDALGVELPRA